MRVVRAVGVFGLMVMALFVFAACSDNDPGSNSEAPSPTASTGTSSPTGAAPSSSAGADGCVDNYEQGRDYFPDKVESQHANGWEVTYHNHYKVVTTTVLGAGSHAGAQGRALGGTYVLVQCGTPEPDLTGDLDGATVIQVPIERFVDGGSIFYAALEQLGHAETLVGEAEPFLTEVEAPYFPTVWAQIESGAVRPVGYDINFEVLADTEPDFYTNYAGSDEMFARLEDLGIPVVYYFPYSETPLGAAEHLKFMALFLNEEARANEIFGPIEERYLDLRERVQAHASSLPEPPTVLIGVVGDDNATSRQQGRFEPQLVREAGARHLPDIPGDAIVSISMETFLDHGADAEFWLDLTFFPSHETAADYLSADPRLSALRPLQEGRVFNRVGPRGYDYFLHGALDVDVMLADLASILYPDLLPDHEPVFLGLIQP